MIKLNGHVITPTIFPDKTSQVWQIPDDALGRYKHEIEWQFESEAEFFQLLQLVDLLHVEDKFIDLYLPYLPYGRQDKSVSNSTTFALHTFARIINPHFDRVLVLDPHNAEALPYNWDIIRPDAEIQKLVDRLQAKVCYPDKGAAKRYKLNTLGHAPVIADKVRDQITGQITGMTLDHETVTGSFLIVDDICDKGGTFIAAAKLLYAAGADHVYLYTTHGLYNNGLHILKHAGIRNIYNYKGEAK